MRFSCDAEMIRILLVTPYDLDLKTVLFQAPKSGEIINISICARVTVLT